MRLTAVTGLLLAVCIIPRPATSQGDPALPYRNAHLPAAARVRDLMWRMTPKDIPLRAEFIVR